MQDSKKKSILLTEISDYFLKALDFVVILSS